MASPKGTTEQPTASSTDGSAKSSTGEKLNLTIEELLALDPKGEGRWLSIPMIGWKEGEPVPSPEAVRQHVRSSVLGLQPPPKTPEEWATRSKWLDEAPPASELKTLIDPNEPSLVAFDRRTDKLALLRKMFPKDASEKDSSPKEVLPRKTK